MLLSFLRHQIKSADPWVCSIVEVKLPARLRSTSDRGDVMTSPSDNLFIFATDGQNRLGFYELCERYVNEQWHADHMTPEQKTELESLPVELMVD